MENSEKEYFEWEISEKNPIFPIDDSRTLFAKNYTSDHNNRHVKERIEDFPPVHNALKGQFPWIGSTSDLRGKGAHAAFPVECRFLFECLYSVMDRNEYNRIVKESNITGSPTWIGKDLNALTHDLCLLMRDELRNRKQSGEKSNKLEEGLTYNQHMLYANDVFRRELLVDLWEQEIETRYQVLLELSKSARTDTQLGAMMDCLLCFDRNIINLNYGQKEKKTIEKKESSSEKENRMANEALECLLEPMFKYRIPSETRLTYKVENFKFDMSETENDKDSSSPGDLKEAFEKLRGKKNLDLLKATQKRYLAFLDKHSSASDFENRYMSVLKYLQQTKDSNRQAQLNSFVETRVKQFCTTILRSCISGLEKPLPPIDPQYQSLQYVAQLIDHLVDLRIRPYTTQFRETLQLVMHMYAAQYFAELDFSRIEKMGIPGLDLDWMRVESTEEENGMYQETLRFERLFDAACAFLYDGKKRDELPELSHQLWEDGTHAAEYLGCRDLFQYELADISNMLLMFDWFRERPNHSYGSRLYLAFSRPLLFTTLLTAFGFVAQKEIPFIQETLQKLY